MGGLSKEVQRGNRFYSPFEERDNTCLNCGRSVNYGVSIMNVIFSINPMNYNDFYLNPSVCSHCINEVCGIFNYDFYNLNDDLLDGYDFLRGDGLLEVVQSNNLNEVIVLILGVRPNTPEDYHVLLIDRKFEQAVLNVETSLLKGAYKKQIKSFQDLLHPVIK